MHCRCKASAFHLAILSLLLVLSPAYAAEPAGPAPSRIEFLISFEEGVTSRQNQQENVKQSVETEQSVQPAQRDRQEATSREAAPKAASEARLEFEAGTSDNIVRVARNRSIAEEDLKRASDAAKLMSSNQSGRAREMLEPFIADHPMAHESRTMLVMLLIAGGQQSRAQGILRKGLSLAPDRPQFKKLFARLYFRQDPQRALRMLEEFPPEMKIDTEYYELYALLSQVLEQYAQANSIYRSLVTIDERNAQWWMGVGISFDAMGESEQAETAFAMAAQLGISGLVLDRYNQMRLNALRSGS